MDLVLKDKVAIVTGAGAGIGRAIAVTLAKEGVNVAVADIDTAGGSRLVDEVKAQGREILFVETDVSQWESAQRMAQATLNKFGRIDILVNNAGVWRLNYFLQSTREDWDVQIGVCYYGTLHCTRSVLDAMIKQSGGCIINIGSDSGRVGEPNQAVYAGAKAGIIGFSRSLAKDVGKYGIRVNVVCPSFTIGERRLEMERKLREEDEAKWKAYEEQMERMLRMYPLRKFGTPQDVANMVVFLASDRAGHVTGQTISVNGGYCMP